MDFKQIVLELRATYTYKEIAQKTGTHEDFIRKIANGQREPSETGLRLYMLHNLTQKD